jgi:NAD(P)-dependent dehydrogenase (short-subunit alcohol dehydrogenase family)
MGVLQGKAAIVTGSARGIGRATVELLAAHGARVLVSDIDGDVAEQAASEIAGETAVFAGDVTAEGAPEALVQTAVDAFGQLDIVVNNAGYTWDGMAHKMSDEQFRAMLEIHTVVPFRVNVNAVAFGFIDTRLTASSDAGATIEREGREIRLGIPQQMRDLASTIIPLGRPGTPEEAAGAIFFLCSPWSNFVQGQVLTVNGGQMTGMTT